MQTDDVYYYDYDYDNVDYDHGDNAKIKDVNNFLTGKNCGSFGYSKSVKMYRTEISG